ncbi:MAG: DUF2243 domain-containing protein [Acidimicrobiales bacterium]
MRSPPWYTHRRIAGGSGGAAPIRPLLVGVVARCGAGRRGTFNLVEGVVDHHILQLHHVRMAIDVDNAWVWDVGFLVLGALLLATGLWLHGRAVRR